jgi:hypothetical protein
VSLSKSSALRRSGRTSPITRLIALTLFGGSHREDVNIEHPAARGVGDAIEIASHAHNALMGEASLELQHRTIGDSGKGFSAAFLGEGLR